MSAEPMLLSVAAVSSLLASVMGLPILDVPPPPDLASVLEAYAARFATDITAVLMSIDTAVIEITRASYITLLLVGVLLYFTRFSKRLGKDLLTGGIFLLVIYEFLIPVIKTL